MELKKVLTISVIFLGIERPLTAVFKAKLYANVCYVFVLFCLFLFLFVCYCCCCFYFFCLFDSHRWTSGARADSRAWFTEELWTTSTCQPVLSGRYASQTSTVIPSMRACWALPICDYIDSLVTVPARWRRFKFHTALRWSLFVYYYYRYTLMYTVALLTYREPYFNRA